MQGEVPVVTVKLIGLWTNLWGPELLGSMDILAPHIGFKNIKPYQNYGNYIYIYIQLVNDG